MAAPVPTDRSGRREATYSTWTRVVLLALGVARGALSLAAIPLVPFLYRDHFLVLVLLRPTKEVLLAAGFQIRRGELHVVETYLAAAPILLAGVWVFFWLGRAFAGPLRGGGELPGPAGRILPRRRIEEIRGVLDQRGPVVVFLSRIAAFPTTVAAAAAGAAGLGARRYLTADGLGAVLSLSAMLLIGYGLGAAYERAGPWVTGAGAAVTVGLLVLVGRWLRAAHDEVTGGEVTGAG
jgi:membrane protein DedA with SNARE-associated domain